jgi:uncharacterized membrane protein YidH (DUF202 family)
MNPLPRRIARTAAGMAALVAFQPLLCLWDWGYKVACGLFLVEIYLLVILPAVGAFLFVLGLGKWLTTEDPTRKRDGRDLMRAAPILALAGFALFIGGFFAVRLGPV